MNFLRDVEREHNNKLMPRLWSHMPNNSIPQYQEVLSKPHITIAARPVHGQIFMDKDYSAFSYPSEIH